MNDSNAFLTLEDLYMALINRKRSFNFDATKSGTPLLIHELGSLKYDEDEQDNGLTAVEFDAANTGANLNRSFISYEVMNDKLMPTFKNRPILGYIHEVDGEPQFYTHNMHIDDETQEIVYDEITVGVIPESNNASLEYNEEDDNYILKISGYIFNEYTKAAEILNREKTCSASVEIAVSKMSYDAKNKLLNIEDGYFAGITILGKTEDGTPVKPGMKNANVRIKDFKDASTDFFANIPDQEQVAKMLEQLLNAIDSLNLNGKGVKTLMHDDTLTNEEVIVDEEINEEQNDDSVDVQMESESEEVSEDADGESVDETSEETFEARVFSNGTATYELSHDDIRYALYNLLDAVGDDDNEWYFIEQVFDDHFVYSNWFGDKVFGQKYTKDGDTVSFDGDRYVLYRELLTQEEKDSLDSLRSNYSAIEKELNEYKEKELSAKREEIMSEESYANFSEEPEFTEIREKISEYSLEDLRIACDLAFAKCVKRAGSFECHVTDGEQPVQTGSVFAFGAFNRKSDFLNNLLKK